MSAEFEVGDKVVHTSFGVGVVKRGLKNSPHDYLVQFEYITGKGFEDIEYPSGCYPVMRQELKPYRTLAEKRQDDFEVLDAASRPWREAPDYYKFPGDVQTTDISMHLNSNGGQAVGYISRSTRIDGKNKETDPRESLQKAIDLLKMELYRLDQEMGGSN